MVAASRRTSRGLRFWSTPAMAPRSRSGHASSESLGRDGDGNPRRSGRPQHQRRLRALHPAEWPRRPARAARPSAWPSTAMPTARSSPTRTAASSTATTSSGWWRATGAGAVSCRTAASSEPSCPTTASRRPSRRTRIPFFAAVGDRNVARLMDETGAALGGETSGHTLFAPLSPAGDGILTALVLAAIVKESGGPLSRLATLEKMPQTLRNVRVGRRLPLESRRGSSAPSPAPKTRCAPGDGSFCATPARSLCCASSSSACTGKASLVAPSLWQPLNLARMMGFRGGSGPHSE